RYADVGMKECKDAIRVAIGDKARLDSEARRRELEALADRVDPVPGLAARFAAREATMKSLGLGLGAFGFHDVWVRRLEGGAPELVVEGRALELATAAGVGRWHLSLSHVDSVAVAYVVAE
ncbi:MAG: holo-ACP synthase, partial [Ilumatobacteraceae bacterium]